MSSSQTTDSPQVKLILDWAEGFKKADKDLIAKHLHKDHRRIIYPRSLNRPEVTREEWLSRAGEILKHWTDIDVGHTRFSSVWGAGTVEFARSIGSRHESGSPRICLRNPSHFSARSVAGPIHLSQTHLGAVLHVLSISVR